MHGESTQQFAQVRNVSKVYRSGPILKRSSIRALDDVNIAVDRGRTLGLVGESGSGKSTLGRILAGLEGATAGTVEVDGREVNANNRRGLKRHWRHTQMVFQNPYSSLNPELTVRETLLEPLRNFDLAKGEAAENAVREAVQACGLPLSSLDRYPHVFSGGQRQRVGIARALIVKPRFIIADEPVSALDVSIQAQIVNLMQDLKLEFGLTYLFIAHDLALVRHVSDSVAVMYRGRIVELGDTASIFDEPLHPYTRLLIESVPIPDVRREEERLQRGKPRRNIGQRSSTVGCAFVSRCPAAIERCFTHVPHFERGPTGRGAACHLVSRSISEVTPDEELSTF